MADMTCRDCGTQLPTEAADLDPRDRQPCPHCGSVRRNFAIQLGGELKPIGGIELSVMPALISQWQHRTAAAFPQSLSLPHISSTVQMNPPSITVVPPINADSPDVLLTATVVNLGDQTSTGQLIACVAPPWFEIVSHLEVDPDFLFKVPPRKLEELIAGAYERDGWPDVVLTPRSGDDGRDVIATRPGHCSVRILDQVKAYRQGHLVTADEVRSMAGVLALDPNASKALITTTSRFAPGVLENPPIQARVPHWLELVDGEQLLAWLRRLLRQSTNQS